MTDVRDEDDLRGALTELATAGAPSVHVVLPDPERVAGRRRMVRSAPVVAAAIVVALALGVWLGRPVSHDRTPSAFRVVSAHQLVGVRWVLDHRGPGDVEYTLYLEPNGRFEQRTGPCDVLFGRFRAHGSTLDVFDRHSSVGLCPVNSPGLPDEPADLLVALRSVLNGDSSWTVRGATLLIRKGNHTLRYHRATPGRTRNFVYRGVGVVVPAGWTKNADFCGSPTANTVLYPGSTLSCLTRRARGVSAVQFAPIESATSHPNERDRTDVLVDGHSAHEASSGPRAAVQEIQLDIPSRRVTVLITSPSRREAADLAHAVYLTNP